MSEATTAKPPHPFWTLTEGRAIFELGAFGIFRKRLMDLPKGDGHSVLFLPGFLGDDASTRFMRNFFRDLNYQTHGWGMGRNVKFDAGREREMSTLVSRLNAQSGQKISIVGWSLGGVFAREIAKIHPDKVRCVISLGSPISNDMRYSAPSRIFAFFNKELVRSERVQPTRDLAKAPPIPTTSILTKTDGVVSWRGSVQDPSKGDQVENIMVPASHVGLGMNPLVMVAIADRLAQPEGRWQPFERVGWREYVYRDTPSILATN